MAETVTQESNGTPVPEQEVPAVVSKPEAPASVSEEELLKKRVIRQIEYYFGNFNLHRDQFMREQMSSNNGWFTMETMLKFKRLASLCSESDTILNFLKDSNLMEVDLENKKIRRKPSKTVPENNDEYKKKHFARTVYIKGFTQDENIDDIHEFLSDFGGIEGIQLRRYPNKIFKGSLMATFFNLEEAKKFIQAPMVYYKCNELQKMTREDFFKEKDQEKENHKEQKKKRMEEQEKKKEEDEFKDHVFVKISSITDDTITHFDIKNIFESCGITSVKFFDRYEKHGHEGYAVYSGELNSEQLVKTIEENKGLTIKIKGADVVFSEAGEDLEKMQEQYRSFRSRFNRDGKKKGKFHKNRKGNQHRGPKNRKMKFNDDGSPEAKKSKVEVAAE